MLALSRKEGMGACSTCVPFVQNRSGKCGFRRGTPTFSEPLTSGTGTGRWLLGTVIFDEAARLLLQDPKERTTEVQ